MYIKRHTTLALCAVLSLGLLESPFSRQAYALGMISTSDAVSTLSREQDQAKIGAFLERQDVRDGLVRFGVNPEEASQRIASLSDAEVRALAGQIEDAPAGGEIVIISLTSILLIVLILVLLGKI